jgi:CelD/BcsL family acetyltransferase involved in cellulose biosynthesis
MATMLANGILSLVGREDVTDYHSPRGRLSPELVNELSRAAGRGTPFRLDSLPQEAAEPALAALRLVADDVEMAQHEVAAVLALPPTFEDWLAVIGKKERHETRRKRRRFEAEIGQPKLVRVSGPDAVADFAHMHRKASGDKGHFMTDEMEALFQALHRKAGAVIDTLCGSDGVPVAAGFGFEDPLGYYLYNSAYDPAAGHASPGVVLVSMLIENTIEAGLSTFDFLKGDETYKFRLGASPRPLYAVTGTFGDRG